MKFFCFSVLLVVAFDHASSKEVFYKFCNEGLGKCVPSTLCSNETVFFDGSEVINSRVAINDYDEESECHYLETCCDPENIISELKSRTKIEESVNEESTQQCIQQCQAEDSPSVLRMPMKIHSLTHAPITSCGFRHKHGIGLEHNLNSSTAQFGEFPWQLALSERNNSKYSCICGASLIHPQVVLTAAHCVNGKNSANLRIRAGEWDTQTTNEPFPHSDHNVIQIVTHPGFKASNLHNDIALLVLEIPVKLTVHINTICLPPQNFKFGSENCFSSGWGTDRFEDPTAYRVILKKLQLPTVPLIDCQNSLRKTVLGKRFKLDTSFLCAGGEKDVDSCVGDGGSSLICGIPNEVDYYYQAGVVSWGIKCGTEGVPGVYANVAKFRDWIDKEMFNLDFGTESYTF